MKETISSGGFTQYTRSQIRTWSPKRLADRREKKARTDRPMGSALEHLLPAIGVLPLTDNGLGLGWALEFDADARIARRRLVIMVPHVTSFVLFNQLLPYSYPRVRVAFRYYQGLKTRRRFHTPFAGLHIFLRSNC